MTQTHQGKVAIVTGAARGLGRAMTLGLLRAGANVVAVDVERAPLDALTEDVRRDYRQSALMLHPADVTRDESADAIVRAAIERFGRLDILVNNAGINLESIAEPGAELPDAFWKIAPADFRRITEVNAIAPFLLASSAVVPMLKQGWGRIVHISTSLDTMFREGMVPYGGSKAAMEAHSAAMAADLAGTGVTLNVLVPGGMVNTRMTSYAAKRFGGRLFEADVMIDPLLWLTSADANEYSGRRIIAALWDARSSIAESLEKAGAPIAWPQVGSQAIFLT
jgi:NAD(P)-dependent dehydrogenase (short-subunit alcohol dehydrogenase family)